jgi:prophage regulatory protein
MQVVHQSRPVVPRDRLIRLPDVEGATGCKKSTIYELMKAGRFPKPVRLSARHVAWSEAAVLQWVQDRIAEAQQSHGGQQ